MNKLILIEVKGDIKRFTNKCINNHIYFTNVEYINNDKIRCYIDSKDYKRIKRINYFCNIKFINYTGLEKVKVYLKDNIFKLVIAILTFVLIDILTSFIIDIEVIHTSSTIRELIYKELENNNIKKFKLRYSYDELNEISKKILDNNKNTLEWISISRDGMKYIVRCEERKINNIIEETGYRHIISGKDAEVTKIISSKGEVKVRSGEYVKKGDILISGEVKLYDTIKGNTLATGTVYGNVWYTVDLSIPKETKEMEYTGKERYNININNKIILNNKYQYFKQDNIKELKILGFKIKIYKEKEYIYKTNKIDEENIENIINDKINEKFKTIGTIIKRNVLKKEVNNSTIDYRVFVVCNEIISLYKYYEVGEINDTQSSN